MQTLRVVILFFVLGVCILIVPAHAGKPGEKRNNRDKAKAKLPEWLSGATIVDKRKERAKYKEIEAKYGSKRPGKGLFPKKCAQCAIPEDQLPKLVKGHPRLMLRPKPWKYGLSVDQLRERAKQKPWAARFKKPPEHSDRLEAALYHLVTGDESMVPALAGKIMKAKVGYGIKANAFLMYDWIYNSKYLADNPEVKQKLDSHIAKLGFSAAHGLEDPGNCGSIWRHRGGGGLGPLLAGLALGPEHPDGKKLLAWGMGYWKKAYIPAYRDTGGGWLGGQHSYAGMVGAAPVGLACWASAVESEDICEVIKKEYDNWLEDRLHFWMHIYYPDKSPINGIGTSHINWKQYRDPWALMSRLTGNPDGYAFMRWMGGDPKNDILWYDEELDKKGATAVFSKPWSHIWGRNWMGYVQMRSKGWEPDSAVIGIKFARTFVWNHALQANQGSFEIYHKGRLAFQSGTYDGFGGTDHWDYYYRRTISSCGLLIFVPGEFARGGGGTAAKERGFVQEPGGQRIDSGGHRGFTQDEYRWLPENSPPHDWASVLAYEAAPDYAWTYVSGDITTTYNNPKCVRIAKAGDGLLVNKPKVDLVTRSLVYIPPSCLAVFDRVNTLDPAYRKAWILQSIGKPRMNGKVIKTEVDDHIEDFDGDGWHTTWPGGISKPADVNDPGRLFAKVLLPRKHYIRRIGGKGYECWSMGANRPPYIDQSGARPHTDAKANKHHRYLKGSTGEEVLADVYNEKENRGYDLANWRIEVSPSEPSNFDNFLHLLHICDTKTDRMPSSETVESQGGNMVGLESQGWLIMFGKRGEVDGEVSYRTPEGKTEHLIVDLKRGAQYTVSGITGGRKAITASKEGTLRFGTDRAGTVKIVSETD